MTCLEVDRLDQLFAAFRGFWRMGWFVDRVEDGDAFLGCRERMLAGVDYCCASDALCESGRDMSPCCP